MIKTRVRKIRSEIQKPINSIWNKEELPEEWKESIIISIYKQGDKIGCSNYARYITFVNYVQNVIQQPAVKVHMQRKLLGIINVDFDTTVQQNIFMKKFFDTKPLHVL